MDLFLVCRDFDLAIGIVTADVVTVQGGYYSGSFLAGGFHGFLIALTACRPGTSHMDSTIFSSNAGAISSCAASHRNIVSISRSDLDSTGYPIEASH